MSSQMTSVKSGLHSVVSRFTPGIARDYLRSSPTGMRCSAETRSGAPVLLVGNPKTGSSTLRDLLGANGFSHDAPSAVVPRREWEESVNVVSIRHPVSRFISGFFYHVVGPYEGGLHSLTEGRLKEFDALEYLHELHRYPPMQSQVRYVLYPSTRKPAADVILRLEDSARWGDHLEHAGIATRSEVPNLNRSGSSLERFREECRLTTGTDFDSLMRKVEAFYERDLALFGYNPIQ